MARKGTAQIKRVILVSTPWPLYSRPSVQLGTLKAYLKQEAPELEVHALHAYLKVAASVGYQLYRSISERSWLAETIYAALLYPERRPKIEPLFQREARGKVHLRSVDFHSLISRVRDMSQDLMNSVKWETYQLAGFSICLCQLTSSLYFITRIKKAFPHLTVVAGGSILATDAIPTLLNTFPEIDYVINGEGELPLSQLIHHLRDSHGHKDVPPIPGVFTRTAERKSASPCFNQLESLKHLPPPDYDDYFHLLKTLGSEKAFFPTLPAEISRGCWWRRQRRAAKNAGCAFCNLNLQWQGYRSKEPKQVVSEVDLLTTKYRSLSVAFTDNLLPMKTSRSVFQGLGRLKKDFRLFGEIRASTTRRVLEALRDAGMNEVQIGVEALSTRLLGRLKKGTTAIQNLEIMKHCEELGIANVSNLILHFPGSDQQDVDETLWCLEFALPFRPLRFVHFWLGIGSPVWQHPQAYGLKAVFNHPNYAVIFPPHISRSMSFMIQGYRGDLLHQRKLWQPVKEKVRAWKKAYAEMHKGASRTPILSFRDGRDFLIVRQDRPGADALTHRLAGTSRALYLFCQKHRSRKRILGHFSNVAGDRIVPFLKMMVDKRLMFEENGRYLSLAVPVRPTKL
ncbi:MAG: RiPP maturation radical SAM C-methyltransferase [Deltaproteobacteria bacterium]|jgi:ribosomal peptide maturation radical SAM protein 1